MSTIDEKKEQNEYQCLIDAYNYCINNTVPQQTSEILKYLNGEHVIRDKNDSPDIINVCSRNGEKALVGIEHFNVSSISKITSKERNISLSKLHEKKLLKIHDKMVNEKHESGFICESTIDEYKKETTEFAIDTVNSSYDAFIQSFRSSWEKHTSNIDKYIRQIAPIAEEKDIKDVELAFLIEIDSNFKKYYCHYSDGSVKLVTTGLIQFFKEIIEIINSTDNLKKINYIVFYNKNKYKSFQSVIALKTDSIESNLYNQGIIIFEYIGENLSECVVDSTRTSVCYIRKSSTIKEGINSLYLKALSFMNKKIPFITTYSIQKLINSATPNRSMRRKLAKKGKFRK